MLKRIAIMCLPVLPIVRNVGIAPFGNSQAGFFTITMLNAYLEIHASKSELDADNPQNM